MNDPVPMPEPELAPKVIGMSPEFPPEGRRLTHEEINDGMRAGDDRGDRQDRRRPGGRGAR